MIFGTFAARNDREVLAQKIVRFEYFVVKFINLFYINIVNILRVYWYYISAVYTSDHVERFLYNMYVLNHKCFKCFSV